MGSELITSWSDHDAALLTVLSATKSCLRIVDDNLARLALENRDRAALLERLLLADRNNGVCIALRDASGLRAASPRLMRLLATFPQQMRVFELAAEAAPTIASLLLADDRHALLRFVTDQARARLIVDDRAQCAPYVDQFTQILGSKGTPISATTLGL